MKALLILTGARGAGKTTVSTELARSGAATLLKPYTTRARRHPQEDEYHFLPAEPAADETAWAIGYDGVFYGMLNAEIARIPEGGVAVTVFEPSNLHHLQAFKDRRRDIEVVIVGLDTIQDAVEQPARVGGAQARVQSAADLAAISQFLKTVDLTLRGDQPTVTAAAAAVVRLLASRGGVLTKETLVPLIEAGTLLTGAEVANVQSASYDLRVGNEIWLGAIRNLDANNNVFEIPPYSYAIVKAHERAALPTFMVGQFDIKVRHFLQGVILSNGPQVDPGYKGDLFCMLFNGNSESRTLRMGDHFSTIQFATTTRTGEAYDGDYQLRDRLALNMPPEAITGPGGAIFGKIEGDIEGAKTDLRKEITRANTVLAILSAVLLVLVGWAYVVLNDASKASFEANKAAGEARSAVDKIGATSTPPADNGAPRLPAPATQPRTNKAGVPAPSSC